MENLFCWQGQRALLEFLNEWQGSKEFRTVPISGTSAAEFQKDCFQNVKNSEREVSKMLSEGFKEKTKVTGKGIFYLNRRN